MFSSWGKRLRGRSVWFCFVIENYNLFVTFFNQSFSDRLDYSLIDDFPYWDQVWINENLLQLFGFSIKIIYLKKMTYKLLTIHRFLTFDVLFVFALPISDFWSHVSFVDVGPRATFTPWRFDSKLSMPSSFSRTFVTNSINLFLYNQCLYLVFTWI